MNDENEPKNLPESPAPEPRERPRAPLWIGVVALSVIVGLSAGAVAVRATDADPEPMSSPTASPFTDQGTPVFTDEELGLDGYSPSPTVGPWTDDDGNDDFDLCVDEGPRRSAAKAAKASLLDMAAAGERSDVNGMASALHETADHVEDAAFASEADADIADPLYRAADLYDDAGTLLKRAFSTSDMKGARTAGRKVGTANLLVEDATRALTHSDVPPC